MKYKEKNNDPGLGTNYQGKVSRIMNPDGSYNIKRVGGISGFRDLYKHLIEMSAWKFICVFILLFLISNLFFASLYYLIGTEQLIGLPKEQHPFVGAFYFSTQTFTTVGYGAIAPKGNIASLLAAFEAFTGLIAFSVITGLIYGRFSKPKAKIGFTKNIIYTDFQDQKALMFKIVNMRDNTLLKAKVTCICSLKAENSNSKNFSRTYNSMELETPTVRFFPLTWTLVHIINETSPYFGKSYEEIMLSEPEIFVLVEAHDETFSKEVYQKHSYNFNEWIPNVKFKRNFHADEDGSIVLNINDLNEMEAV